MLSVSTSAHEESCAPVHPVLRRRASRLPRIFNLIRTMSFRGGRQEAGSRLDGHSHPMST